MLFKLSILKLFTPILRLVIVVTILLLAWKVYNRELNHNVIVGLIILLCLPVLPTVYLFVEYFIATKDKIFEITDEYIKVSRFGEIIQCYSINNISDIKLYKSANMEKGNFPLQTAEIYYHAEIFTLNKNKIILTSILKPGLDQALELIKKHNHINVEIIRTAYSTIYW